MKKILIIEDENNLARFIELELKHEGFEVAVAHEGRNGLDLALDGSWDIILLDLMLPELNGIEICRRIRKVKQTPIIILTARDSVMDRVSGLDSGADDYLTKPFAIEELLARIRALLRRFEQISNEKKHLVWKDVEIDLDSRIVKKKGNVVELTKREYDLLVLFMQNINRVLTRDIILDKVWQFDSIVETNIVDVYVRYLRNKLDSNGEESMIQTVRGTGYVIREI